MNQNQGEQQNLKFEKRQENMVSQGILVYKKVYCSLWGEYKQNHLYKNNLINYHIFKTNFHRYSTVQLQYNYERRV